MPEQPIIFEEKAAAGGKRIGVAILNQPKALNSISLPMIRDLERQLDEWAKDDGIAAVWLEGAGDKAFCAGGDIVALYRSMTEGSAGPDEGVAFFTEEYALDYQIHTYPKPVVAWGHGFVMGGGVGLLAGASHRVVTEKSRVAMPEVTIGLYPDVGASWFLNHMPGKLGLFIGVTGVHLNAADACYLGMADRMIRNDQREAVLEGLLASTELATNAHAGVTQVLRTFERESVSAMPSSAVRERRDAIQQLMDADDLATQVERIAAYDGDDEWFQRASQTAKTGSPTTMAILERQLRETRLDGLRAVFDKELNLSIRCLQKGEFAEGIRALLIDKDKNPRWRYPSLRAMDPAWVESFFE
ncbi:enoyl-CoA hydratase/isomerase family protein [Marinobacter nanhaiticus D15-8W]|uniref:3-hydroxyisobutyryl-CoA hydrolase n=1 Tax=Marinobacter nanhaiticus D15-8W TaxID=626887 RepID=N6X677_9GAMM|nr:enoyl-CoA hydratase/isomerase family protein [Marinobacter nanhaiticus]ENO16608.1 enoyl-CoA hydratase/isomerase family protein [Marinobacter nanhaiticus D15-8W]BES72406.1 enoyl-CoA hydratase/isomerase family protein [Marinobacter nanhaiticus D15-8W]